MPVKWTRQSLMGSTKTQGDFNLAHRFNVEMDGILVGGCHTVEGLEHEHEVVEFQDGDDKETHYRPGRKCVVMSSLSWYSTTSCSCSRPSTV